MKNRQQIRYTSTQVRADGGRNKDWQTYIESRAAVAPLSLKGRSPLVWAFGAPALPFAIVSGVKRDVEAVAAPVEDDLTPDVSFENEPREGSTSFTLKNDPIRM